jgi:Fe-S-cluster containining protein
MGCTRCGDCCEHLGFDIAANREQLERLLAATDPTVDDDGSRADVEFILEHWRPDGNRDASCDMFDRTARLCTAYEGRPPVCRGYPWYGEGPSLATTDGLPARCGYREDWQAVPLTARR